MRRPGQQNAHSTLRRDQFAATTMLAIATAIPVRVTAVGLGAIERIAVDDELVFAALSGDERPFGGHQQTAVGQLRGMELGD